MIDKNLCHYPGRPCWVPLHFGKDLVIWFVLHFWLFNVVQQAPTLDVTQLSQSMQSAEMFFVLSNFQSHLKVKTIILIYTAAKSTVYCFASVVTNNLREPFSLDTKSSTNLCAWIFHYWVRHTFLNLGKYRDFSRNGGKFCDFIKLNWFIHSVDSHCFG